MNEPFVCECNSLFTIFGPEFHDRLGLRQGHGVNAPRMTPNHSRSLSRRVNVPRARWLSLAATAGLTLAMGAAGTGAGQCLRPWPVPGPDRRNADQAPRRDLPGERLVRPLLRHLPERGEHRRASRSTRRAGTPRSTGSPRPRSLGGRCSPPTPTARTLDGWTRRNPAATCSPATRTTATHAEQKAFDGGPMDKFPELGGHRHGHEPDRAALQRRRRRHGLLRRQHRHRRCGTTPSTSR